MASAEQKQRDYYTHTADLYDSLHVHEGDEHERALELMSSFTSRLNISTILDVGSGTGRAVRYFQQRHLTAYGVEPVPALIERAIQNGAEPERLFEGSALSLPFPDNHFDAVCACALLHHVKEPSKAISEMCRVARRAVFISDGNRFGMGSVPSRWLKLLLYKSHLWPLANLIKTRGHGYTISEGDGLAYSYSVYDNLKQLQDWTDRVYLLPTSEPTHTSWLHPLLTTHHILICAFKD